MSRHVVARGLDGKETWILATLPFQHTCQLKPKTTTKRAPGPQGTCVYHTNVDVLARQGKANDKDCLSIRIISYAPIRRYVDRTKMTTAIFLINRTP